jgi:hypothetical protein
MRNESSGVATAQNPRSSAGGLFQFINSTWGNVLRRMDPQTYGEMTNKQLAALKSDPELSWKAAQYHIATDIAPKFQAENIGMTPGRAYLAWFQGPQGAVNAIQSNPESKVSDIFPGTIKANANMQFNGKPYADWSMADLQSWADKKMAGVGGQSAAAPVNYTAPWSNAASALGDVDQRYLGGSLGLLQKQASNLLNMVTPEGSASLPAAAPSPIGFTEPGQRYGASLPQSLMGSQPPGGFGPMATAGGGQAAMAAVPLAPKDTGFSVDKMSYGQIAGLAGLGNSLMQAGQGQPSWKPGTAAPVTRGQWRDDIFAGLLGPRAWG